MYYSKLPSYILTHKHPSTTHTELTRKMLQHHKVNLTKQQIVLAIVMTHKP